jgi:hypothetical protein
MQHASGCDWHHHDRPDALHCLVDRTRDCPLRCLNAFASATRLKSEIEDAVRERLGGEGLR